MQSSPRGALAHRIRKPNRKLQAPPLGGVAGVVKALQPPAPAQAGVIESIFAAKRKSLIERPPMACVVSSTRSRR